MSLHKASLRLHNSFLMYLNVRGSLHHCSQGFQDFMTHDKVGIATKALQDFMMHDEVGDVLLHLILHLLNSLMHEEVAFPRQSCECS